MNKTRKTQTLAALADASETPASLGYRMPAEWEPHAATWIAWPHNRNDWPGKFQPIPWVYAEIVRNLAWHETVHILVEDATMEQRVRRTLEPANAKLDAVEFHRWPTNRVWTRDYGPTFVRSEAGEVALVNFGFNAWAKYDDWQLDAQIPARVAKQLRCRAFRAEVEDGGRTRPFVLEGGSIDTNGSGTLLTTEECLLSDVQQRNPGLSREQIEAALHDYLGITKVLWLGNGIVGDDTHGHVDDIARFVRPDTVLMAVEGDTDDPNHAPLADNLRRMRAMRDERGRQLTVVELPMPRPLIFRKYRVPASYANFYIADGVVLAPVFNDPNDRIALNTLAEAFPDRDVVPIYCGDLIWGFGAIHCMTQQQPRGIE